MAPENSLRARATPTSMSQMAPPRDCGDPAKACEQFEFTAATAFREGLVATIARTCAIREPIFRCMFQHARLGPGLCAALE
jgi:hypothetical protein